MATPDKITPDQARAAYSAYLERRKQEALSAVPPSEFDIFVRGAVRKVLLMRSNRGVRAFYSKLTEYGLLKQQIEVELAQSDGEGQHQLENRLRGKMDLEQQGRYVACMLYSLTRENHSDLTWEDCQEAVPGDPVSMMGFADAMRQAIAKHAPEAEPEPDGGRPTKAPTARGPKRAGRSKASKRSTPSRSSS